MTLGALKNWQGAELGLLSSPSADCCFGLAAATLLAIGDGPRRYERALPSLDDEHLATDDERPAKRGLQDRGTFALPGESDSLAVLGRALAGYPKSSSPVL